MQIAISGLTALAAALFAMLAGSSPAVAAVGGAAGEKGADGGGVVLVAGATGRTGREIVRELRGDGYRVRALVRDNDAAREVLGESDATLEYVEGDVRDRSTLEPAMAGVDYVISAIGATRTEPGNGPEFVDFGGVRNLAAAAAAAKVKQMVMISSAGVTHEDHPLNKMFDNVLLWKAKGEQALRDSGVPYTIVRPGGLADKPGGDNGVDLQQGDTGRGMIPRADVASVCVAALKHPEARNRSFEVFSAKAPPSTQWAEQFGALKPDSESP